MGISIGHGPMNDGGFPEQWLSTATRLNSLLPGATGAAGARGHSVLWMRSLPGLGRQPASQEARRPAATWDRLARAPRLWPAADVRPRHFHLFWTSETGLGGPHLPVPRPNSPTGPQGWVPACSLGGRPPGRLRMRSVPRPWWAGARRAWCPLHPSPQHRGGGGWTLPPGTALHTRSLPRSLPTPPDTRDQGHGHHGPRLTEF